MYYIYTKEEIIEKQKGWPEGDLSKNKDFNQYEFWLVADDGESVGADSIEEFNEYFKEK